LCGNNNSFASFDGRALFTQRLWADDVTISRVGSSSIPVVLVHGFATDTDGNWIRPGIAEHLTALGYVVVMFDLRGHGRSDRPTDDASYCDDAMARDVIAMLSALAIERCHLVGYSLGAIVVARALTLGLRPVSVALCGMGDCLVDPHWEHAQHG
jgi:pimeloyl-ACP methyl ester carboxylesterase